MQGYLDPTYSGIGSAKRLVRRDTGIPEKQMREQARRKAEWERKPFATDMPTLPNDNLIRELTPCKMQLRGRWGRCSETHGKEKGGSCFRLGGSLQRTLKRMPDAELTYESIPLWSNDHLQSNLADAQVAPWISEVQSACSHYWNAGK